MSDTPKKPSATEMERRQRQAEALRENLRRRKRQSRARLDDAPVPEKDRRDEPSGG